MKKPPKFSRRTAHLQRQIPVLALVAAMLRIKMRKAEQLKLKGMA